MDPKQIQDLPVCLDGALYETILRGCHVDEAGRIVEAKIEGGALGEDGKKHYAVRTFRLGGVSRFAFAIHENRRTWLREIEGTRVLLRDLTLDDLSATIDRVGYLNEGDDFVDVLSRRTRVNETSFDIGFSSPRVGHTLDLNSIYPTKHKGRERIVDIRVWFQTLEIHDDAGQEMTIEAYCTENERWREAVSHSWSSLLWKLAAGIALLVTLLAWCAS